jgi:hypothetical protein
VSMPIPIGKEPMRLAASETSFRPAANARLACSGPTNPRYPHCHHAVPNYVIDNPILGIHRIERDLEEPIKRS